MVHVEFVNDDLVVQIFGNMATQEELIQVYGQLTLKELVNQSTPQKE
jgi:hypothetical protein